MTETNRKKYFSSCNIHVRWILISKKKNDSKSLVRNWVNSEKQFKTEKNILLQHYFYINGSKYNLTITEQWARERERGGYVHKRKNPEIKFQELIT